MEPIKFTIIALPSEPTFSVLNSLKSFLYLNNFRFKNKPNNSVVHLTLCEGKCSEAEIDQLNKLISIELKGVNQIVCKYERVTADTRGPVKDKCEFDNSWVSILFNNDLLKKLSLDIDNILIKSNVSTTSEYIERILENVENTDKSNVIANHMNICNYAKPDKAVEAKEMIVSKIPQEIIFDRVAFRYDTTGELAWIISLQ